MMIDAQKNDVKLQQRVQLVENGALQQNDNLPTKNFVSNIKNSVGN